MPLKKKNIYITGGTGGIGAPLVDLLRKAGAEVMVYNRKKDGDLLDQLDAICANVALHNPDILINMAGMNECAPCEDQNLDALIALNLTAPMRLTQAVLPAMKQRNAGQIINVGSMMGIIPLPYHSGYVAAKAGLKAFSDCLRRELCNNNVHVTHVAPRAVKTKMNDGVSTELNARTGTHYDMPDDVAKRIYQAILKRETDVRLGWTERFFAFMQVNFPFLVDKGLRKNVGIGEEIFEARKSKPVKRDHAA